MDNPCSAWHLPPVTATDGISGLPQDSARSVPAPRQFTNRVLSANVAGRVKKIRTDNFLVPLFEAISNSVHAIVSGEVTTGEIVVELIRHSHQQDLLTVNAEEMPITGFVITDNGIGFTEPNMLSFCEADSPFKASIGGKGIGRFAWLKFFDRASVESVFKDGSKHKRRTFTFSTSGVDFADPIEVKADLGTRVTLGPLKIALEPKTKKSLEQISIALVEHFIAYLVTNALPRLVIKDGAATREIRELYQSSIGQNATNTPFNIGGFDFSARGIRFYLGGQTHHAAFFCGDKRAAEKILLSKKDAFFAKKFEDSDLRQYSYLLFVESQYLDKIVNDDREGFQFPDSGSLESTKGVTKEQLLDATIRIARDDMKTELTRIKEDNLKTVNAFVNGTAPQYRYIVAKRRDAVAAVHERDPSKIDLSLRRLQFEEELKTRAELAALMHNAQQVGESTSAEWRRKADEIFARLNEEGKANLATYIVQRRAILDLLKRRMEITEGVHSREDAIHSLIFPMRQTSEDVSYEDQNLWIIDERLAYHYYLGSDKPLTTIPPAESSSPKEPDLIIFDRPIALTDRPENEQPEAITIIEFKRPLIASVDGQKNPVDQVLEYIELIQDGRARNRRGRPLAANERTYFFGYVICEIDPLLKRVLSRRNMEETPDGRGMFGFFAQHRAHIEVVSYDKMLDNAIKRNRILFERLQLPSL